MAGQIGRAHDQTTIERRTNRLSRRKSGGIKVRRITLPATAENCLELLETAEWNSDESDERLLDQRRRLQWLARFLVGQLLRRQTAELIVDERQEFLRGDRLTSVITQF